MSHIVRQTTEIKDLTVLNRTCDRLSTTATQVADGRYRVYLRTVGGYTVSADFNLETGQSSFDSDYKEMVYAFEEQYAMEAVRVMAEETGATLTEVMEDGNLCFILE